MGATALTRALEIKIASGSILHLHLGDSCSRAGNLSSLASPFCASTVGMPATFSGCGRGPSHMFFVVLQPHETITIGLVRNDFDTQHAVMWSESCPKTYSSSDSASTCVDDPDTQTATRTNTWATPRRLWYVVRGYDNWQQGSFTLGFKKT